MSYLVLVRHGQSVWNLEKKFTGWVDVDLTENGKSEAKKAGELINKNNLKDFLPEQTHIFANNKFLLSAYSLRWFYKQVKRNPNVTLQDLNA